MARQAKKLTPLFAKHGQRAAFLLIDALVAQLKEDASFYPAAVEQGRDDLVQMYDERKQIAADIMAECNRALMP